MVPEFYGNSIGIYCTSMEIASMEFLMESHGNSIEVPLQFWELYGSYMDEFSTLMEIASMEFLMESHGNSIEVPLQFWELYGSYMDEFCTLMETEMCNVHLNLKRNWYLVVVHFERIYMKVP